MKYRDKKNANKIVGRTNQSSYHTNPKKRHAKRKRNALHCAGDVTSWCNKNGVTLAIYNNGHHWVFTSDGGFFAEWWPSSAKFVHNREYSEGIHTHGTDQVIALIENLLDEDYA